MGDDRGWDDWNRSLEGSDSCTNTCSSKPKTIQVIDDTFTWKYTTGLLQTVFKFIGLRPKSAKKMSKTLFTHMFENIETSSNVVKVSRETFEEYLMEALGAFSYAKKSMLGDLNIACSVCERQSSVTIILCGTSGCGKSTLSSLLASRLGITSVLSTDSIRHMLRSFDEAHENNMLWSSTYEIGSQMEDLNHMSIQNIRKRVIHGYKAQCEMIIEHLDQVITFAESRNESLIVEGVHLSMNFMIQLMKKHKSIVPFLIYISNDQKHKERFAVRARAMTLSPVNNKYIKYFRSIRMIQEYLCKKADKHAIPKIDNSNIDRSVATIHTTLLGCLRKSAQGTALVDAEKDSAAAVLAEFQKLIAGRMWKGKEILQLIRRKRHSDFAHDFSSNLKIYDGDKGLQSKSLQKRWDTTFYNQNTEGVSSDDGFIRDNRDWKQLEDSHDEELNTECETSIKGCQLSEVGSVNDSYDDESDSCG